MINDRIIFVLGAGASIPYGFPSGEGLRHDILYNFETNIISKIEDSNEKRKAKQFLKDFDKFGLDIDLFLSYRDHDYSEIGKVAIISSILNYEQNSYKHLFESAYIRENKPALNDKEKKYKPFKSDWYTYINRGMPRYLDAMELIDDIEIPFTFITFNYDRSFEHYLFESFSATYISDDDKKNEKVRNFKEKQIAKLINKIGIHHVYGSIGKLDWELDNGLTSADYGIVPDEFYKYKDLANNINIMHNNERVKGHEQIQEIFKSAEKLFFLGFGFDDFNLKILNIPKDLLNDSSKVFSTTYGLSEEMILKIKRKLWYINHDFNLQLFSSNFKKDTTCLELLQNSLNVHSSLMKYSDICYV